MSKADLDLKKLPRHIAVIMDGNGRWAEKHGLTRAEGHEAGVKSVSAVGEGGSVAGGQSLLLARTCSAVFMTGC